MSNERFDPERFLDGAVEAISRPIPDETREVLAEHFGRANARDFVLMIAYSLMDRARRETLIGALQQLVFLTREREVSSGRHVEAAQNEFLSLYTAFSGREG